MRAKKNLIFLLSLATAINGKEITCKFYRDKFLAVPKFQISVDTFGMVNSFNHEWR